MRARQLEFVWTTPWKASPDRHHEARATFSLADDGFGRAVVEVRERRDDGGKVARSQTARAYSTVEGFKRSAKTLRWRGGMVTMTPSVDFLGRPEGTINFYPSAALVQDETPPHVPRLARGRGVQALSSVPRRTCHQHRKFTSPEVVRPTAFRVPICERLAGFLT